MMRFIVTKSIAAGLLSMLASLIVSFTFVPMLGGQVAGAGLIMTIVCPLVIGIPASAMHLYQSERVRRAEAATSDALARLATAYEKLRLQSRQDDLTGVLNRYAFQEELENFSRNGVTGSLVFLDLDHFKSINDRYGHATGDDVLRAIGLILAKYQGPSGIVGRLGGEEFALFQSGLKVNEMLVRCEEVRELIQRVDVRSASGARVPVSASMGAFHCSTGFDALECLKAADINLYQAKARGRNRVVVSA